MRPEDLMLDDWVECLDSTHETRVYAQIDAIEESRETVLLKQDISNWFLYVKHLEPIPLTEEILKNNGWRKRPQRYFDEWYGPIPLNEQGGKFYYAGIPLNYVHELQHLLRLCGGEKEITLTD